MSPTKVTPVPEDTSTPTVESEHRYVIPIVHTRLPERLVDVAFWTVLGATAVAGAIELPVAAAVAGGVMIARHARR
ncbi:MAG: hypothetical protein ACXV8R_13445 [Acidimicrobiia bacterium]